MKIGDRVKKRGLPQCAIVRELDVTDDGTLVVTVHWGTDGRGEVLERVDATALVPFDVVEVEATEPEDEIVLP